MATEYGLLTSHTVLPPGVWEPVGWVNYLPEKNRAQRLTATVGALAVAGCRFAVGPMVGSTWGTYRITIPGGEDIPPFPGEPPWDDGQLAVFQENGFLPLLHYHSAVGDLAAVPARRQSMADRLASRDIVVRVLCAGEAEARIAEIHALIHEAFAHQPFFTAIPLPAFAAAGKGDPGGAVLVAEQAGRLLGFVRGYPHPQADDIWIIKTLARVPEGNAAGIGSHLLDCAHANAIAAGYRRVVHALMHETNSSRDCSRRCGLRTFRTCVLLGRSVGALAS